DLYKAGVVELIKQKVQSGTPYIGWSAGSNLTGPTICTTNDMPIVQPESFASFGFFPFQLNPHYHNIVMEGFHGETRDQRLEEFLKLNGEKQVVCLPEGTALQAKDGVTTFLGEAAGVLMYNENGRMEKKEIVPGTSLETLLKSL
ncbi:MAG TPA: dipeptidase PepE, partial [Flavisolibacter sp.]|nr:dipeptidase PepE [Flavisolibacter sp.]